MNPCLAFLRAAVPDIRRDIVNHPTPFHSAPSAKNALKHELSGDGRLPHCQLAFPETEIPEPEKHGLPAYGIMLRKIIKTCDGHSAALHIAPQRVFRQEQAGGAAVAQCLLLRVRRVRLELQLGNMLVKKCVAEFVRHREPLPHGGDIAAHAHDKSQRVGVTYGAKPAVAAFVPDELLRMYVSSFPEGTEIVDRAGASDLARMREMSDCGIPDWSSGPGESGPAPSRSRSCPQGMQGRRAAVWRGR
jgi:hypothetical protein